jgi:hypothetical protein
VVRQRAFCGAWWYVSAGQYKEYPVVVVSDPLLFHGGRLFFRIVLIAVLSVGFTLDALCLRAVVIVVHVVDHCLDELAVVHILEHVLFFEPHKQHTTHDTRTTAHARPHTTGAN